MSAVTNMNSKTDMGSYGQQVTVSMPCCRQSGSCGSGTERWRTPHHAFFRGILGYYEVVLDIQLSAGRDWRPFVNLLFLQNQQVLQGCCACACTLHARLNG